jgi:glycerophosphoryl diester phosphodiesterase
MIDWPPGTCIFAHRGASAYAPENTLAAFELAADMGAHGIEFDVQRTRDGRLIIHHDRTLGRTEAASGRLSDWAFADLRALDVGSWFGSDFAGARMPTPEEVVESVGDRLLLNFELVNDSLALSGMAPMLVDLFRRMNLFDRALISSFNPRELWQIKKLEPRIAIGALWGSFEPWLLRAGWWRRLLNPDALHPEHVLITANMVQVAHARGQRVHAWTVNDEATARRLCALGVDMLIGDHPDRLLAAVADAPAPTA